MEKQIEVINEAMQSLTDQMHELLSQPHLDLNIEFGGSFFHFYMPTTVQEQDWLYFRRKELICSLIQDAIKSGSWERIFALNQLIVRKEGMVSPIASEEYEVIRNEAASDNKSISLNFDAYYVENERPEV